MHMDIQEFMEPTTCWFPLAQTCDLRRSYMGRLKKRVSVTLRVIGRDLPPFVGRFSGRSAAKNLADPKLVALAVLSGKYLI